MKIENIAKIVVTAVAVGITGKVIYTKAKNIQKENKKQTIDYTECQKTNEEKTIVEKVDDFKDSLTPRQKAIVTIGGVGFIMTMNAVNKRIIIKNVNNTINSDPIMHFMKLTTVMVMKSIRMGELSYDDLLDWASKYEQEVM